MFVFCVFLVKKTLNYITRPYYPGCGSSCGKIEQPLHHPLFQFIYVCPERLVTLSISVGAQRRLPTVFNTNGVPPYSLGATNFSILWRANRFNQYRQKQKWPSIPIPTRLFYSAAQNIPGIVLLKVYRAFGLGRWMWKHSCTPSF